MNSLRRLVSALRTTGPEGPRDMSVAQRFALRVIARRPGLTMSELAEATLTTRSTVSEVVDRLEDHGLVRRELDDWDRRRLRLRLTSDGLQLAGTIGEAVPERLVRALNALGPAVAETLADTMEAWVAEAGLDAVSPDMFGEPSRGEQAPRQRRIRATHSAEPAED